jgi:hypothetical protein
MAEKHYLVRIYSAQADVCLGSMLFLFLADFECTWMRAHCEKTL